jgi:hypothetical protein
MSGSEILELNVQVRDSLVVSDGEIFVDFRLYSMIQRIYFFSVWAA